MPHGPWLESFFTTASVRWWGDTLIKWILFGLTDWMTSATGPDQESLLSHDISSACVIGGHLGIICSLTGETDAKLWSSSIVFLTYSPILPWNQNLNPGKAARDGDMPPWHQSVSGVSTPASMYVDNNNHKILLSGCLSLSSVLRLKE